MMEHVNQLEKNVLVIGSTVCDILIRVDHLPSVEEDVNPESQQMALGGCAFNVWNMLRLFQVPALLYSPVGTGLYGEYVRSQLNQIHIIPSLNPEEENGCCYCLVDCHGDRTFMALHGAEYHFYPEWFARLDQSSFNAVYVCGLELEESTGSCILDFLQTLQGKEIYFAPGARIMSIPRERMHAILQLSPVLHLNAKEASALLHQDSSDLKTLARQLYGLTHNTVIITAGAQGCVCIHQGIIEEIPAVFAAQVDGTGAGDSHLGTYIACRRQGMDERSALMQASKIASAVISQTGAALSESSLKTILK
ncbi:MAG: PfkB family carbohydrate kinase [Solobacterium sp.]|jgi:sugar/nucleoside kinase (ribokinase family)|nr:PfkB family carbohydrate kinase [Solobacterium sp.]